MGNVMETCIQKPEREKQNQEQVDGKEEEEEDVAELKKETSRNNCRRVKILLSKVELAWLMVELEKEGKGLEEVLEEIVRGRGRGERSILGWKPSLQSIIECPELQEMDRLDQI